LTSFWDTPRPSSYIKDANWTPGQWSGPGSDSSQENAILLEKARNKTEAVLYFEDEVCCWDLHVDGLLSKTGSRMYILRVCRRYGHRKEHLSYLFYSIILSLFLYGIEIWGAALHKKYLESIDKFFKRAYRHVYVLKEYKMSDLIETRYRILFNRILDNPEHILYELLPEKRL
jgi:hypothetical protein